MKQQYDIYSLTRNFFDWSYENPEKINPNHVAMYFFIIEHCNRLGWKEKFGLPTQMTMEAIGIKNYKTFAKTFSDLIEWGLIKLVQKSKNQYSANIIALVFFTKATTKALSKATTKAESKQSLKQVQSSVDINKQDTSIPDTLIPDIDIGGEPPVFNFKNEMLKLGFDKQLVEDWLKVRSKKRSSNTKTALDAFLQKVQESGLEKNVALKHSVVRSWAGFDAKWLEQDTKSSPEPDYKKQTHKF